ncbi:hypothetical protein ABMA28_003635 [Loxostege sticticalis]|uniref:PiggyBac transposable element-derived protein domain-containing protein n=1 Tax=Loxostege sticticalis TaxID=481309 RepID=A0ABD0SWP2_LOXSC
MCSFVYVFFTVACYIIFFCHWELPEGCWKSDVPTIGIAGHPGCVLFIYIEISLSLLKFKNVSGTASVDINTYVSTKYKCQNYVFLFSFTTIERAEACGFDEEEGETLLADPAQLEHVRQWVNELPGTSELIPLSCNTVRIQELQAGSSGDHGSSHYVTAPVDPVPSRSVGELAASGGMDRNIPDDDELDERVQTIVHSVERAMDEAVENLLGISTDFNWQTDFDTFGGVPKTFPGTDIMEHITIETNRYAKQVIEAATAAGTLKPTSRLHRWVDTDVDELYVFFAIYIIMGIYQRSSQHEYWEVNSCFMEVPKFRQLMIYNRFILLSKFLHFTDNYDASQDLPLIGGKQLSAQLRKIAPALVHLNSKFESLYNLHQDIAVDESLTLFKGRLSWVQTIRLAARFAIKSFELRESKTGYLYRFDIYTGKNTERGDVVAPSADLAGKSTQVVLDLLKGLERLGHCVTMDNYYNCPALARYLKSIGFDCLGTLRFSRKHVPKEIAKVPKNVAKGTIVACHSGDVSCLAWKDSKVVSMISTYRTDETTVGRTAGRAVVKPLVVRDYNNTMGGVDLKHQKLSMYLMERKRCLKWYMKMFKRLLNVSVHNALILLLSSLRRRNMPSITHRNFRKQLARSLMAAHRPSTREIVVPVEEAMRLRKDIVNRPEYLNANARMRCHTCLRKGIRKMVHLKILKCVTCDEGMCFGDCWVDWHSLRQLPGKTIHVRICLRS